MIKKVADKELGFVYKIDHQPGLTIGQLAGSVTALTGIRCTPAMIYNYEKRGLIGPAERTDGGFRLFRVQDIHMVACIKRWQSQGKSLAEIKDQLEVCRAESEDTALLTELPVDRRMRFLEAAMQVFPQKGFAATTLLDIAQEAGVSSSAIYQYFNSKEELFLALAENLSFIEILNQANSYLTETDCDSYETVRSVLINVGEGFLNSHTRNAEVVRLFIAESRSFPDVGKSYCQRLIAPIEEMLERFISHQIEKGLFRPVNAKLAVHAFFGIFLNFIVTQQLLQGEDILRFPEEDRVDQLVDIYLAGMLQ